MASKEAEEDHSVGRPEAGAEGAKASTVVAAAAAATPAAPAAPPAEEEPSCSVCLCDFEGPTSEALALRSVNHATPDDTIVSLPCPGSHMYHKGCIVRWLRTNHNCPLCRARVEEGGETAIPAAEYDQAMFDQNGAFRQTRANRLMLDSFMFDLGVNCCLYNSYFLTEAFGACVDNICVGLATCCQQVCAGIASGCDLNGIAVGVGAGCTSCWDGLKKSFGIQPDRGSSSASSAAGGGASHHGLASSSAAASGSGGATGGAASSGGTAGTAGAHVASQQTVYHSAAAASAHTACQCTACVGATMCCAIALIVADQQVNENSSDDGIRRRRR